MDPSLVLEETTQNISNLDAEFRFILNEIKVKDLEIYNIRKKCQSKEAILQKFIKQNGPNAEHPHEEEIYKDISESLARIKQLQDEKNVLANSALFISSRHLNKLAKDISLLEEDGVLAPLEDEVVSGSELSRENSTLSISNERKKRALSNSASASNLASAIKKRRQNRNGTISGNGTVSNTNNLNQKGASKQQNDNNNVGPPNNNGSTSRKNTPMVKNVSTNVNDEDSDNQKFSDELFSGTAENEEEDKTLYCFCQSVSFGEMVACDGPNCKYEWFHYSCVNLKEPPKGTWYCPDCKQEMLQSKNLTKKKQ